MVLFFRQKCTDVCTDTLEEKVKVASKARQGYKPVALKARQGYKPRSKKECGGNKYKVKVATCCVVVSTRSWNKTVDSVKSGKVLESDLIPTECCLSMSCYGSLRVIVS